MAERVGWEWLVGVGGGEAQKSVGMRRDRSVLFLFRSDHSLNWLSRLLDLDL